MLALIGVQRWDTTLCLQGNWVQTKRKERRSPRVEANRKGWTSGEEGGRGRHRGAGQGRVGSAGRKQNCNLYIITMKHLKGSDVTSVYRAESQEVKWWPLDMFYL